MLTFFKTNDPYRLAGVFLLLLIIRVPMFIYGVPMILPELKWMLIGEHLGTSGVYTMYQDVWDYTGPLAVFVYKWLYIMFGKSRASYFTVSLLLVVVQAGIFNRVMLGNKAYNSSTYVPALIYMLCMNAYFDFLTLSPLFMSMTFVLLSMNNLFQRMDNKTRDELFIFTGVYLGLATLFYLPAFLFFVVTMLSLLLYTGSIVRRLLLLVYGFAMVAGLAALYFFWFDDFLIFQHHFLQSLWVVKAIKYLDWTELALASMVPMIVLIFSYYKVRSTGKYINFQEKIQQVMLMFFWVGFLSLMMAKEVATFQLIFFVPTVAFFISHYLLLVKPWIVAELNAVLFLVLILFNHLAFSNQWFFLNLFVNYEPMHVVESDYAPLTYDKKILVLGDELHHYQGASLATPYLNWQLSRVHLQNLNYYDNSAEVFTNFMQDLPEVLIDIEGIVPALFATMPTLGNQYIHHEVYDELYLLKE